MPRFGIWHYYSGPVPADPPLSDNRPLSWDDDLDDDTGAEPVGHDGPLAGLRMPACEDQEWDAAEDVGQAAGRMAPILQITHELQDGNVDPYTTMTSVTSQERVEHPADDPEGAADPNLCVPNGAHLSVARSSVTGGEVCLPQAATGGVAAANPAEAHVYEAYVQGFCALGAP